MIHKNNITLKSIIAFLIFIILISTPLSIQARRLYYAEEFYLYVMNLYQVNASLERNIRFMQWALKAPFDNPVRSLAKIETENDFKRYKALFKLHVNLLIIDSYLQLARRFDKEHIYFFNLWYAKELKESFIIARYYYETALVYWDEVKRFTEIASEIPGSISIDQWEDDLWLIQEGELDYKAIINEHLDRLDTKQQLIENYLSTEQET